MDVLVSAKLESYISSSVRKRGAEYAHSAAVSFRPRASFHDPVRADVAGTDVYAVVLRYEAGTLLATCTCPYFEDRFDVCKHIWATVLQCEARRIGFSGPVRSLLCDEDEAEIHEEEEEDEWPARPVLARFGRNVVPLRSWRKPAAAWSPPSRWRSQLGRVGREVIDPINAMRPLEEIIWIVDPMASSAALSLEVTARTRKKNGELGKPQNMRLPLSAIPGIEDPADREILSVLTSSPFTYEVVEARHALRWPMALYLLPKLASTGRLWIRTGMGVYETAVSLDMGEPWRLVVKAEEQRDGNYLLVPSLRKGEESRSLREPLAITQGGLVIFHNAIERFHDEGAHAWAALLRREEVEVPAKELGEFAKTVVTSAAPLELELPPSVTWKERQGVLHASLEIRMRKGDAYVQAIPSFTYDGVAVSVSNRARGVFDEATRTMVLRDLAEERRKLEVLHRLNFSGMGDVLSVAASRLVEIIPEMMAAGWEVRGAEGVYAAGGDLDLSLRSGVDWFDLEASADFGSQRIRLPRLLDALRKGQSFVALDDGKVALIRSEWKSQLEPFLATASEETEQGLRFRSNQVLLLDALLATRPRVAFDDLFEQARRKILDLDVKPEQPPASFRGVLRPYQNDGLGWFSFLRELGFGGCLADDMGLGKTIQVLALLEQRRTLPEADRRPSLVVVPRSVVFNWKREAAAFTPGLRVLDHSAPGRLSTTEHFTDYDLVITTYALLRREVERFAGFEFDYAILDEAQAIKNASSQAAKAATLLRARHRLALSGTPVENHLGELASLFEFLNPGMLRAKSSRVVKMLRGAGGRTAEAVEARTMLARTVRPFILRRTKGQVAQELPERVEQTIYCDLEPKQRKLYDELRDYYRASLLGRVAAKGLSKSKIHILEALLRMRQAACHPGLVDIKRSGEASAKIDRLFEELPILLDEGHKVLVFSQFTSLLAIVRAELQQRAIPFAYLDGKSRDREEQVRRFQEDPNIPLFLISLKAGGLGLNLTAAEYVFLLDPWWNPAVEAQAIDRAHRIGQTRNVVAYRLVARDTIEDKILLLQQSKRELAEAIISEENSILRQLTTEDLDLLLS